MNTYQQINLFQSGQPDEEAIRLLRGYEDFALKIDPRGYCVCTSEGKDSRVLGHLMRRAGVKHFYIHNITGIDPPELVFPAKELPGISRYGVRSTRLYV